LLVDVRVDDCVMTPYMLMKLL